MAKRHSFVVEVTDMSPTSKSVRQVQTDIHAAINLGLRELGRLDKPYIHLRVKSKARVDAHKRR